MSIFPEDLQRFEEEREQNKVGNEDPGIDKNMKIVSIVLVLSVGIMFVTVPVAMWNMFYK